MSIIQHCMKRNRWLLLISTLCMSLSIIADLLIPWLLQILIDDGVTVKNALVIQRTGQTMLAVILLGLAASMLAYWLSANASARIGQDIREKLYAHVLALSYETTNAVSTSSLITRLTNDVLHVQNMFLMLQRVAIKVPISLVVGLFLSIKLSPSLSLTYLVTVPLLCLNMAVYVRFSARYFPKIQATLDKINLNTQEMLIGILTIKGARAAKRVIANFNHYSTQLLQINLAISKRFGVVGPTSMIIFNNAIVAVLCLGFFGFTSEIGKLIAFVNYSMQILSAVITSSSVLTMLTRAKSSIQRIEEIMTLPESEPVQEAKTPQNFDLQVKDLTYIFPDTSVPQLQAINCTIPFNQRVGLVGLPGSGKTLFLNAIVGLLENYQGNIFYGGVSLRHIDKTWRQSHIGYVQQNATILAGTIRDNLFLGKADLTLGDMTQALDHAMASELYQNNADTIERAILQRGHDLSGGQKQRLSIARILALAPNILILDDSTSALDHDTEKRFFANLETLRPQTQIIVSQRLSTLRQCDRILLFDHGRIVAEGRHHDLLQTSSLYEMILGDQIIEEAFHHD